MHRLSLEYHLPNYYHLYHREYEMIVICFMSLHENGSVNNGCYYAEFNLMQPKSHLKSTQSCNMPFTSSGIVLAECDKHT